MSSTLSAVFNPFLDVAGYIWHENFLLWCRFLQWPHEKGGTGGGGWVHPKGADSMAVSGLCFENAKFNSCIG